MAPSTHNGPKKEISFVDQLANPERSSITQEYGTIDDFGASQRFGARFSQEYSYWAWRACALAAVMMLISTKGFAGSLFDLVCEALLLDGYAFKNLRGGRDIGWKHKTLSTILEKRDFSTRMFRNIPAKNLLPLLSEDHFVIASVRSKTGGHMVLIKGYKTDPSGLVTFLVNDPDVYHGGGENKQVVFDDFQKIFLGGGIAVWTE